MDEIVVELKQYKDMYFNDVEKRIYLEVDKGDNRICPSTYVDKVLMEIAIPEDEYDRPFIDYIDSIYKRIMESIIREKTDTVRTQIYDESIFIKFIDGSIIEFRHSPHQGTLRHATIKF